MIELIDVTQHYGVRPILRDIHLRIGRGELVVVLGPNGMGKSTLLGVMGGALAPQRGTVRIDGLARRGSVDEELEIRRRAVYLPDRPWLPGNRTGASSCSAWGGSTTSRTTTCSSTSRGCWSCSSCRGRATRRSGATRPGSRRRSRSARRWSPRRPC